MLQQQNEPAAYLSVWRCGLLISWEALAAEPLDDTPFLVKPYVPREGIVLLHGKYSTGKSPLTWELARCVGEGLSFFGHETAQGRVVYIDVDTPRSLIKSRIQGIPAAHNVWWAFPGAFPPSNVLVEYANYVNPNLVIINTLRKVHQGTDIESSSASAVYGRFQRLFPAAALLFVHHDRKDSTHPNAKVNDDEAFAGTMAWINDAQSAVHISRHGAAFAVKHTKSQVSELAPSFTFQLDAAGHVVALLKERLGTFWLTLPESLSKTERVREASRVLGVAERRVWEALAEHPDEAARRQTAIRRRHETAGPLKLADTSAVT